MKYNLHLVLAGFLSLAAFNLSAQTVSDFENITLPADTTYLQMQAADGDYSITSGNVTYPGNVSYGGSFITEFNCSNTIDTVTPGPANQFSNITGSGAEGSANFGTCFVGIDFADPNHPTIPVGVQLINNAVNGIVAGCYITNTTYAYRYMKESDYFANNHFWFNLIIRGYNNGTPSNDSVVFTLADFTDTNQIIVNTWQWVDLTSLGDVDSLTFDLSSNDTAGGFGINTPAYFAIDNLTTMDNNCPEAIDLNVTNITQNSAIIGWSNSTFNYEIAVDESATLEPVAPPVSFYGISYYVTGLNAGTLYYAHIRTKCSDNNYSDWKTISFTTSEGTGIFNVNNPASINVSPNPATDILNLNVKHPVDVAVYDINGKLVVNIKSATTVDITGLASGLYMLKIFDSTTKQTGSTKFVKK